MSGKLCDGKVISHTFFTNFLMQDRKYEISNYVSMKLTFSFKFGRLHNKREIKNFVLEQILSMSILTDLNNHKYQKTSSIIIIYCIWSSILEKFKNKHLFYHQETTEKLQSMRFQLQLSPMEDQKTPIQLLQERVR